MRRFFVRLSIFLLPLLAALAPPAMVLLSAGEVSGVDVNRAVKLQRDARSERLYGLAYSECASPYKLAGARDARPELLILGSSRVLQLRSGFFRDPAVVYNAGRSVSHADHLPEFWQQLPADARPRAVLVGLDAFFFNPRAERSPASRYIAQLTDCGTSLAAFQRGLRAVYPDLLHRRVSLAQVPLLLGSDQIGLSAILTDSGYRHDGSYLYGRRSADAEFRDTFARIAQNRGGFEYASEPAEPALAQAARFLDLCKASGTQVIGFMPPYAPRVIERMNETGKYAYIPELSRRLKALFSERGLPFWDFTDLRPLGATDAEFIDGFHGSERAYARMLIHMADSDPRVAEWIARPGIVAGLAQNRGPYRVLSD